MFYLLVLIFCAVCTSCGFSHNFILGHELLVCCLAHRGSTGVFLLLRVSLSYSVPRDLHRRAAY